MVFTFWNLLQIYLRNKTIKEFRKTGRVLTKKEIGFLLSNKKLHKILPVFESAIVSHKKIKKKGMYTRYPFYNIFEGHDNFKKAYIAQGISGKVDELKQKDLSIALSILDNLSPLTRSYNPLRLIAWDSIGNIAKKYDEAFEIEETRLKQTLNTNYIVNSLGGILFMDKLKNTSKRNSIEEMLKESFNTSKHNESKALMLYFMHENFDKDNLINQENLNNSLKNFYSLIQKNYCFFDKESLYEGLEKTGIIKKQDFPLWKGTDHEKIITNTINLGREFFQVIGAYSLRNE